MTVSCEMPRYKCHKEVHALKIKGIGPTVDGRATIHPEEDGYASFDVEEAYIVKHKPHIGGYYVVYEGGYVSFSPEAAFDNGYVPLEQATKELDAIYTKSVAEALLSTIAKEGLDIDEVTATLKLWAENGTR